MMTKLLLEAYLANHPDDAARSLEKQGTEAAAALLGKLPLDVIAPVLDRMDPMLSLAILKQWPVALQGDTLSQLEPHRAAALLRRMNAEDTVVALEQLSAEKRRPLELLTSYPDNTVGARMDPCYPCLPEDITVTEALQRIQTSVDRSSLWWFIVNRNQMVVGVVSLRALLSPIPNQKVADVCEPCLHRISALTDVNSLGSNAELQRFAALPVVDEKNTYIGAIRIESVAAQVVIDEWADSLRASGSALGELYQLGLFGLVHSLDPGEPGGPGKTGART